jgi:hypothetical protein
MKKAPTGFRSDEGHFIHELNVWLRLDYSTSRISQIPFLTES